MSVALEICSSNMKHLHLMRIPSRKAFVNKISALLNMWVLKSKITKNCSLLGGNNQNPLQLLVNVNDLQVILSTSLYEYKLTFTFRSCHMSSICEY